VTVPIFGGRIDYYNGTDGPTLRIECDSSGSLVVFLRMVRLLCSELEDGVCLTPNNRLVFEGIASLELATWPKRFKGQEFVIVNGRARWRRTPDEWCDAAGLIEPLVRDPTRFQYIRAGDRVVEVRVRSDGRT
jgi:hypothetical protein